MLRVHGETMAAKLLARSDTILVTAVHSSYSSGVWYFPRNKTEILPRVQSYGVPGTHYNSVYSSSTRMAKCCCTCRGMYHTTGTRYIIPVNIADTTAVVLDMHTLLSWRVPCGMFGAKGSIHVLHALQQYHTRLHLIHMYNVTDNYLLPSVLGVGEGPVRIYSLFASRPFAPRPGYSHRHDRARDSESQCNAQR